MTLEQLVNESVGYRESRKRWLALSAEERQRIDDALPDRVRRHLPGMSERARQRQMFHHRRQQIEARGLTACKGNA